MNRGGVTSEIADMDRDELLEPSPPGSATPRPGGAEGESARPSDSATASEALTSGLSVTLEELRAFYGNVEQVKGIHLEFPANQVTAIIGPSGCGKSTMVRCINRMHEEIPGAHAEGRVLLDDLDVYDPSVDVVAVRRAIGMVFQKPNPFPTMSIFDNVASGPRLAARRRGERSKIGSARGSRPRCAAPVCGMRSQTGSTSPARGCPGASSSGCASHARSPWSPTCC